MLSWKLKEEGDTWGGGGGGVEVEEEGHRYLLF